MKKLSFILSAFLLSVAFVSCNGGKTDSASSSEDSLQQTAATDEPYAEPGQKNTFSAKLGGHTYNITINRQSDSSLPVVTDELGKKFYDNRVDIEITRDGGAFFSRTYTKEAFEDFLSSDEKQGTVLLGMAFDSPKSDGHSIRLGAQIGQVGIEEGPAFVVEIPLDGGASGIVRDKNQDTTGEEGMTD